MEGITGVGTRIAGARPAVGATWNGVARSTAGEGARWRCAAGAGDAVRGRGGVVGSRASMVGNRDARAGVRWIRGAFGRDPQRGRRRSEKERQNPRALMQRGWSAEGETAGAQRHGRTTGNCARLQ
jgi:hypothetical protein